jgi:hypothetical protein
MQPSHLDAILSELSAGASAATARSRCGSRFGLERTEVDLADPRQRQLRAELDLAWTRPLDETRAAVLDQLGSQSAATAGLRVRRL